MRSYPTRDWLRLIEIAEFLGVTKQRAHMIAEEEGLPCSACRGCPRPSLEPVRRAGVGEALARSPRARQPPVAVAHSPGWVRSGCPRERSLVSASVRECSLGPYESGNAGTARRVDDRLGRMPHGLNVVLMQVVDECRVIPLGVLRPDPGLAADGRAVCDGGREECIHGVRTLGRERNMRRCGHGIPTADREVVQFIGSIGDTVVLRVEFLIAEWGQGGCIEPPARIQVCHDEEHVIDDDAANRHSFTLSTPAWGSYYREATRLLDSCAAGVAMEHRAERHLAVMRLGSRDRIWREARQHAGDRPTA